MRTHLMELFDFRTAFTTANAGLHAENGSDVDWADMVVKANEMAPDFLQALCGNKKKMYPLVSLTATCATQVNLSTTQPGSVPL